MEYEKIALKILSKFVDKNIAIGDIGTESYVFDVEELDHEIIPDEYHTILINHKDVMTHLYSYKSIVVYIIVPIEKRKDEKVLIGVLEGGVLVNYVLVK